MFKYKCECEKKTQKTPILRQVVNSLEDTIPGFLNLSMASEDSQLRGFFFIRTEFSKLRFPNSRSSKKHVKLTLFVCHIHSPSEIILAFSFSITADKSIQSSHHIYFFSFKFCFCHFHSFKLWHLKTHTSSENNTSRYKMLLEDQFSFKLWCYSQLCHPLSCLLHLQ